MLLKVKKKKGQEKAIISIFKTSQLWISKANYCPRFQEWLKCTLVVTLFLID